jgi:hypothetical protein
MAFKDRQGDRTLLIIGTFLSLLLVACSTEPSASGGVQESPLLAALERKHGLIAYLGMDRNLYTIDQAGGNQVAITQDADLTGDNEQLRWYGHFAWSPEADKIAFVELTSTAEGLSSSVYSAAADGSNPTLAFSSSLEIPELLYWLPNGTQISFLTTHPGNTELRLRLATADGSSDAQLIGYGRPFYWDWGPEGQALAIHSGGSEESNAAAEISIRNFESGHEAQLDLEPGYFHAPAWSPDGTQLLIAVHNPDSHSSLLITNRDGDILERFTDVDKSVAFGWSPTGENISYITSNRRRYGVLGHLRVVDATDPSVFFESPENTVMAYFWSPDGRQIAYFTVQLAPSTDPESDDLDRALGLSVMDVRTGETQQVLFFASTPEFFAVLENFDQYKHFATIWSPNSEDIVLPMLAANRTVQIVVMTADGSIEPREIAEGVLAFWSNK